MPKYRSRTNSVKALLGNLGGGILALNGTLILDALDAIEAAAKRHTYKRTQHAANAVEWLIAPDDIMPKGHIPASLAIHGLESYLKVEIDWFDLLSEPGKVVALQLIRAYHVQQQQLRRQITNAPSHSNSRRRRNHSVHIATRPRNDPSAYSRAASAASRKVSNN